MEKARFVSSLHEGEYLDYIFSEPGKKDAPLVFYIHGAGSRGDEVSVLLENTAIAEVSKKVTDKAIIIAPQCHANAWFDLFEVLCEFISTMKEKYSAKKTYIIGSSMGGYTTWQLLMSHPEWFTKAVPICGGGMYWNAKRITEVPIWAFHGLLDNVVFPEESLRMVRAVNKAGGKARITLFPYAEHNAWVPALSMDETWKWLFSEDE